MKLIKKGGETINDYTPLILAIRVRNVDRVEELLNRGADPNLKDERERWTPMKWNTYMYLHGPNHNNRANEILCDSIAELLVRHGANMMDYDNANFTYNFSPLVQNQENTTTTTTGGKGKKQTKKHRLSKNKKTLKKYRILKGFSTNVHRRKNMKGGLVPINRTIEERINDALDWNYTPLIDAIINVDTEEVERLLNVENANELANQVDSVYGWSPMKWTNFLYYHVYNHEVSEKNELAKIIQLLFNAGASVDNDNDDMSNDGGYDFSPIIPSQPPIQLDSESEDASLTESDTSSEQDSRENDSTVENRIYTALHGQYTPLINAIIENDASVVQMLLDSGSDSNQPDSIYNWSPMKWALFVYAYGIDSQEEDVHYQRQSLEAIISLLESAGARDVPDEPIDTSKYNFEPVISQQNNSENENENENENQNETNNRTTGGTRKRKKHKKLMTMKKRRKSTKKGGSNDTQRTRVRDALRGNYTPLINAIIEVDINEVNRILANNPESKNQRDNVLGWCPRKWVDFVFIYSINEVNFGTMMQIVQALMDADPCFDNDTRREYNFAPIVNNLAQEERVTEEINNTRGGSNVTEQTRINDALTGNYTPLINAIISQNVGLVNLLLTHGADVNRKDDEYNWCPLKWAQFVYDYNGIHDFDIYTQITQSLYDAQGEPCYDIDDYIYNFTPVILDVDNELAKEKEEQLRKQGQIQRDTSGGSNITEQTRINDALRGNYTPLINAIIAQNVPLVESILENGADPNERDNDIYRWCPLKWAAFVFHHNNVHDPAVYRDIKLLLLRKGSHECFDENHIHENSYNFSPARTDMDELLERRRTRRENEINNRFKKDTSGGTRKRKVSKGTKNNKGVNLRKNK
jgi:hypothetical protein